MTSCPSCSLPNTGVRAECAFCSGALLDRGPLLARLSRKDGDFRLHSGERLLAEARLTGGVTRVQASGGTVHSLVTMRDDRTTEVVLFDARLNVVAGLREVGASMAPSALLSSADEQPLAIVRADGVGGLHVIAPDGSVLLFAGHNRDEPGAVDLLITEAGTGRPLVVLFALVVALESENLGPLGAPTPDGGHLAG